MVILISEEFVKYEYFLNIFEEWAQIGWRQYGRLSWMLTPAERTTRAKIWLKSVPQWFHRLD